jgi:hypothetical protein
MTTLCRRFPEDSTIPTSFINATALHVRNPDMVKKTAKTYLAARKDDLLLWEALGASSYEKCVILEHVVAFTRGISGVSLSSCGRRDESLQIFSQACMFGSKLASVGKEALPRVVLSAVLTGGVSVVASFVMPHNFF